MTAIVPSDVLFKLSAPNANAGNSQAGYPGTSWGGYLSTSVVNPTVILDNIFTDITGPEFAANQVDYACIFIQNNTASNNSMMNTVAWIPLSSVTGSGSTIAMGADPAGITGITSTNPQAAIIQSAILPPTGVNTWVVPTSSTPSSPSYTNGLVLGNIAPTQCVAVWLQRTAVSSSVPSLTSFQIMLSFSTGS